MGHFSAKYQGYSLTCWSTFAHFHHFSICNQNQSILSLVIFRQNTKVIGYTFWRKVAQFHHFSICNQNQSMSILVICRQNTKVIALLFGQQSLIFITFQSAIKINQFQFWSFVGKIPRLQPYFLVKNPSFSSLFNLQSKSINVNIGHFSANLPRLQPYFQATNRSISSLFNLQSKSINFKCGHLLAKKPRLQPYFLAKNRSISSLLNLQSKSINFNFGHLLAKYQGYSRTFGQKSLNFITFQSAIKINQCQYGSFLGKIPRLQPYFLANNPSFSSLFNLQSKSINVNIGHFSAKYQGYSLTFWPQIAHFHHFSICNQNQSISIVVFCWQNTKIIALLFGQNSLNFITFQSAIKINQFQYWPFLGKIPRLQPYFLANNPSFSLLFNLQSKSINFNFGHFSAKYQGYSLTFWPQIAHFHHFSICNQNQSISMLVICWQNTKVIALLFGQQSLIFITFQSAIKINQF